MDPVQHPAKGGRFWEWIERRPKPAFWGSLLGGMVVGVVIGASGGGAAAERDEARDDATAAKGRLAALQAAQEELQGELSGFKSQAEKADDRAADLAQRIKKLTARAEVPDFGGGTVADARSHALVDELGWRIATREEITDEATPGTVISQAPAAGRTLKNGKAVTLVLAKKPPPKPKQWVTISTLTGGGSTKTPEFRIPARSQARLVYSMPDDGNNAIVLMRPPDEYVDLMLNEIGPQSGSTRLYQSGTMYLDVTGAYSIQVQVFKRPE